MRALLQTLGRLLHAWFDLTREEQAAVLLVLALFLLGLAVRTFR
jgi:hypothetical protein